MFIRLATGLNELRIRKWARKLGLCYYSIDFTVLTSYELICAEPTWSVLLLFHPSIINSLFYQNGASATNVSNSLAFSSSPLYLSQKRARLTSGSVSLLPMTSMSLKNQHIKSRCIQINAKFDQGSCLICI